MRLRDDPVSPQTEGPADYWIRWTSHLPKGLDKAAFGKGMKLNGVSDRSKWYKRLWCRFDSYHPHEASR